MKITKLELDPLERAALDMVLDTIESGKYHIYEFDEVTIGVISKIKHKLKLERYKHE